MEEKKYWARRGEYLVHRDGTIYKMNWHGTGRMREVKQFRSKGGYLMFNYKRRFVLSHRFIAELFIPNPENFPEINHKNEIKYDNRVENLEWCNRKYNLNYGTYKERMANANINGKTSKKVYQYALDGTLIREWPSTKEVQRRLGYSHTHISECCLGKWKTAYGFLWSYNSPSEAV